MPRIRCHYVDCVFLDEGYCAAAAVELEPEEGCLTYSPSGETAAEDAWDDNDALEEDWEEAGFGSEGEEEDEWEPDDEDEDDKSEDEDG
jgi:hypothetical protein